MVGNGVELFREYVSLYELRNRSRGELPPPLEREWRELSFTIDAILGGDDGLKSAATSSLRSSLPLLSLRVPVEKTALCSDESSLFPGVLRNLSRGGAYLHCSAPLKKGTPLRIGFRPHPEERSLSVDARVVWTNPGRALKRSLPEGVGVEFFNCPEASRRRIRDILYDVVGTRLSGALLI